VLLGAVGVVVGGAAVGWGLVGEGAGWERGWEVGSGFWVGFGLPFLVGNFLLNRAVEEQHNWKVKMFILLSGISVLAAGWQGRGLLLLAVCKLGYLYLQQNQ
jgi:hypothetical protein